MAKETFITYSDTNFRVSIEGIEVHKGSHKVEAINIARKTKRSNPNSNVFFEEITMSVKKRIKPVRVHKS